MVEEREAGARPVALSRREATTVLLIGAASAALPALAAAPQSLAHTPAMRAAAEFALSF